MARQVTTGHRTLKHLRGLGCRAGMVERFIGQAGRFGVRKDLFGFIDIIALDCERMTIIGVQTTSSSGMAEHRRKIIHECREAALEWLECGGEIHLYGWRKVKVKRGGRAMVWKPRIETITLTDLD